MNDGIVCDLFENGHCTKFRKNGKCRPSDKSWFEDSDELSIIEKSQMCRKGSVFGNEYFRITREQLEALEHGKVLFCGGEYGIFISLASKGE